VDLYKKISKHIGPRRDNISESAGMPELPSQLAAVDYRRKPGVCGTRDVRTTLTHRTDRWLSGPVMIGMRPLAAMLG